MPQPQHSGEDGFLDDFAQTLNSRSPSKRPANDRGAKGYWDDQLTKSATYLIGVTALMFAVRTFWGFDNLRVLSFFAFPSAYFLYRVFKCQSLKFGILDWIAIAAIGYLMMPAWLHLFAQLVTAGRKQ